VTTIFSRARLAALALCLSAAAASAQQRPAPRMPHPAAGREQCLTCHGPGANEHIKSAPASHHYAATACAMCHRPAATMPPAAKHSLDDAHAACTSCHRTGAAEGVPVPPASHETYHESLCRGCHEAGSQPGDAR